MSVYAQWYVYDGSQVSGPYSAEALEAVRKKTAASELNKLMVSKRGLDQWHPFSVLENLFEEPRRTEEEVQLYKAALSQSLAWNIEQLTQADESNVETLAPSTVNTASSSVAATEVAEPDHTQKSAAQVMNISALPPQLNDRMLRTRLRLGENRNRFVCAFLLTIITIGLYIPYWIRAVYRELNWNLHNDLSLTGLPNIVLLCVPGYQMLVFHRLARYLQLAESQRGYTRTNVRTATILSFFPPLAMFYLQGRFNDYWHTAIRRTEG